METPLYLLALFTWQASLERRFKLEIKKKKCYSKGGEELAQVA